MPLITELRHDGRWVPVGFPLEQGMPDASMSHNGPAGRQIYSFGCRGDHSVVRRSESGADREFGERGEGRHIVSLGYEEIARVSPEDPFECWLQTDRMAEPMLFRFRHT